MGAETERKGDAVMLDEKDLQAIAGIMDNRIAASEERVLSAMDSRIAVSEERMFSAMDTKSGASEARILANVDELISRRIGIVMENEVMPKFNLLADGIADIQEKLVPRSRVDDLEDDVRFLKSMMRQMAEEIRQLKKAQ